MGISGFFKPDISDLAAKKDTDGLIKALKHRNSSVRAEAASALGNIGEDSAVEPLIIALRDNEKSVQNNATKALVQIGEISTIKKILRHHVFTRWLGEKLNDAERVSFLCYLIGIIQEIGDEEAAETLIDVYYDQRDDPVQQEIITALAMIGKPAVQPLINCLFRIHPRFRRHAARLLGEIKDERAIKPLIENIRNEEGTLGHVDDEWKALGSIGKAAVEPLVEVLNDKENWKTSRIDAARALGKINDKSAIESLTRVIEDDSEDKDLRFRASEAIQNIQNVGY